MQKGLISVVMPCFNAEKFLRDAVDSVLNQTYPSVELIVVDDGSTDGSLDILKGYGDRIRLIEQENQGPYPARNAGIGVANGEFVAFLDADDYWAPDCLESLHGALEGNDAALSYCGWQNIGLPGPRGEPYIPPDYEQTNKVETLLSAAAPWPIHAALTRRTVLDEVGGFDLEWRTCMDYDLWLRIAASRPVRRVEKVLAFYRHHAGGQITSTQWRQADNVRKVKEKFIRRHPELVARIPPDRMRELVLGAFLKRGYDCYWRRDLVSAQRIFRIALRKGGWGRSDLKYLLPALLPPGLYRALIRLADGAGPGGE